uniref:Retrovirus-related Pol polyprotein from transposon TNT 1-94 n=1 Tax=Cajanus cajan TaxID=3821 RepID=A0A151U5T4_CAJCA|nr:Retrovirus-related Pol polyprotein from transposon TNT 1-94 [Cajanus cajan]
MWIFSHKDKSDSSFERHKARLVGDGKTQQVGVDCGEMFSPVVKPATIRIVLSLALSKAWSIHQLDVKKCILTWRTQGNCLHASTFGVSGP